MSTVAKVVLVAGIGGAAFLLFRSQMAQQQKLAAAAAGAAGAVPASGGGVQGLVGRLWEQWKSDPLGIEQHKATLRTAQNVATSGMKSVAGAVGSVTSFVKGIF